MNDGQDLNISAGSRVPAKITNVECIPLNVPFTVPFKISTGAARPVVETLIVKIHTDQGIVGVGETQAWRRQGSSETLESQINTIKNYFEPQLLGHSPFDINAIMHGLNENMYHSHYSQAPIGDALYDIVGKMLGVPVYQALRKHFGTKIALRVDANAALNYDSALNLLSKLEPFDIETAEQPLAIWDIDGMSALSKAIRMPLMADECAATDHALLDIIAKRAATSAQTKVGKNGVIYHIRRLWHLLAAAGMGINPGNHPATSIATASVAQMCGSWPGNLMAGVFAVGVSDALAEDIAENPIIPENGEVTIPEQPGLGITIDEDALKRLRIDT